MVEDIAPSVAFSVRISAQGLVGSIDDSLAHYVDFYNNDTMAAWWPVLEDKGITQVTFSDEEINAFKEAAAAPAAAAWIENNTAKGLPAQELYDLVTGMIADAM